MKFGRFLRAPKLRGRRPPVGKAGRLQGVPEEIWLITVRVAADPCVAGISKTLTQVPAASEVAANWVVLVNLVVLVQSTVVSPVAVP